MEVLEQLCPSELMTHSDFISSFNISIKSKQGFLTAQINTDSPHSESSLVGNAPGGHHPGKYLNGDHMLFRHVLQKVLLAGDGHN